MVFKSVVTLRGHKPYQVTASDTGQVFTGKKLFVSFPDTDVTGESVDSQNVSSEVLKGVNLDVGKSYELSFESKTYGGDTRLKVVAVRPVSINR